MYHCHHMNHQLHIFIACCVMTVERWLL